MRGGGATGARRSGVGASPSRPARVPKMLNGGGIRPSGILALSRWAIAALHADRLKSSRRRDTTLAVALDRAGVHGEVADECPWLDSTDSSQYRAASRHHHPTLFTILVLVAIVTTPRHPDFEFVYGGHRVDDPPAATGALEHTA